jgi:NIMA (never in mitosis gene a)-related kinase
MSERDKLQSLVEVEALAKCRHVNIVRYKKAFVDSGFLCIIMEYGDHGGLYYLCRYRRLHAIVIVGLYRP